MKTPLNSQNHKLPFKFHPALLFVFVLVIITLHFAPLQSNQQGFSEENDVAIEMFENSDINKFVPEIAFVE